ncbi:hypothetical protein N9L90_03380 [Planctomycetota bacterium]|nr:hypothetical protein [Planctomycetota bacterium]
MERAPQRPDGVLNAVILTLGVGGAAILLLTLAPPPGSLDDVFVVLTEARRSLGALGEDAWNPAPVDSCTSPADVLLKMALLLGANGQDPLRASGWLALLEVALFVAVSVRLLSSRVRDLRLRAVCAVGLVGTPGLLESATYRLEGPIFAVLWMLTVAAAMDRAPRRAVAWGAALAWVRPEGMLLGLAASWLAAGPGLARPGRHRAWAALLVVVPVSAYRLMRFGDWLPNTYRAKRSDDLVQEWMDGSSYAVELLFSPGGLALVLLAVVVGRGARVGRGAVTAELAGRCSVALALTGLALAVMVASGGDSYAGARLALPMGIPLWLGLASAHGRVGPRVAVGAAAALLQAALLVGTGPAEPPVVERLKGALGGPAGLEVFEAEERALEAASIALGDEVLAHRHLQRVRWFCPEMRVMDLTGLTDREVAALPAPGQVTFGRDAVGLALERRVGALHLDPVGVRPAPLSSAALVAALSDPRIAAQFAGPPYLTRELAEGLDRTYLGASYPVPGGHVNLLVREDLAERFQAAGFTVSSPAPGRR